KAGERLHVAVGDVMDELADSPAAFSVGSVELLFGPAFHGSRDFFGQSFDGGYGFGAFGGCDRAGAGELADWVTGVGSCCGAHDFRRYHDGAKKSRSLRCVALRATPVGDDSDSWLRRRGIRRG